MNAPIETNEVPRGTYAGSPICAPRTGRRFYQCAVCGGWVDSANPKQMAEHEDRPALSVVSGTPITVAEAS